MQTELIELMQEQLRVALPFESQDDYAGLEGEVTEGRDLASQAESLLTAARKKYSL
ncbi:hypothetical protein SAMN06298214_0910 [Bacteroidales bacterium WCE2004]|nr:hypothetical protein SAMN06298214_0910 [Bacteroidales bacterium WCE2004]